LEKVNFRFMLLVRAGFILNFVIALPGLFGVLVVFLTFVLLTCVAPARLLMVQLLCLNLGITSPI